MPVSHETSVAGAEELPRVLDRLVGTSIRVLHHRRVPRSRGTIDHLVVSRSAVWVIAANASAGLRPTLRVDGGIVRPRVERLFVGDRDQSRLVTGVQKQVEQVRRVVGDAPVIGALCLIDADWPLFVAPFSVDGVHVLWPKRLVARITEPRASSLEVKTVTAALSAVFPPG